MIPSLSNIYWRPWKYKTVPLSEEPGEVGISKDYINVQTAIPRPHAISPVSSPSNEDERELRERVL